MMSIPAFAKLQRDIRACTICAENLPLGPRPIFQISRTARILIAGQAPGSKVHASGIPFDDASGDRLRDWLGLTRETFFDANCVAILPMGFCYPGTGKSGDLPPRPECAVAWREKILSELAAVKLTLVVGQYAMAWHLGPRNNIWLKKNPWFARDVATGIAEADQIGYPIKKVLQRVRLSVLIASNLKCRIIGRNKTTS